MTADVPPTLIHPVTDRTELYELALYSPKGTTQSISWRVTNRLTAAVATGTISTDMPTTANLLTVRGWMSVGGTSAVIGIALNTMTLDPLLT